MLQPTKAPTDFYTWQNFVAVSPRDVQAQDGRPVYVLINDRFVLSAVPFEQFQPGMISLSDPQRTWMQIALTDTVKVQPYYDPFSTQGKRSYLGAMDIDIGFAGKKTTDVPFDQDELAKHVTKVFNSQIFAPGQKFLTDFRSLALIMTVKTVKQADLSLSTSEGAQTLSDPTARGILLENTEINFFKDPQRGGNLQLKASKRRPATNAILNMDFKFESMGIGGLDQEFSTIFRRAFASRLFPPGLVQELGIMHVKGILLHGPPGTGKTLIARQIGKMLNAREPKVINGPEVLNKYVGQSEENIRKLFADAEQEQKAKGDESELHIIIFDELDAVCKQRGSGGGGGTGVGDSVVNQLLSKLDGVDQLNNILLIGMTNRMDMIDDALLRPGRLELHVEISLPDEAGRVQILNIHTASLNKAGRLAADVNITEIAHRTKNFSGAELSGLSRAAVSWASRRHINQGASGIESKDLDKIQVTMADFDHALEEVKPAFGTAEESLETCFRDGVLEYSATTPQILSTIDRTVQALRREQHSSVASILLHGPPGSGKTALAAKAAIDSQFPFIRMIKPRDLSGMTDIGKVAHIQKVFSDAYKSDHSVILLDNFEKLIDFVPVGPRFSAVVLSALTAQIPELPPHGRKLLILATTARRSELVNQLGISRSDFQQQIPVPSISGPPELYRALELLGALGGERERQEAVRLIMEGVADGEYLGIGIKDLLTAVKKAGDAETLAEDVQAIRVVDLA